MDARMREERRRETSQRRARPAKPQRIYFMANGVGQSAEVQPDVPLELCIEAVGASHRETLQMMNDLAGILLAAGEFENALDLQRKTYSTSVEQLGQTDPDTKIALRNLLEVYVRSSDLAQADHLCQQATTQIIALADCMGDLGEILTTFGFYNQAEERLTVALDYQIKMAVDRTPTLHRLAALYERSGQQDKAAEYRALITPLQPMSSP